MEEAQYVTDAPVATSVHLAMRLRKPLLIEGHAGVGKTEVAKVMARMLGTNLIRLQCYEGLDAATALYEWNYQKQLLHIKLAETSGAARASEEQEIFSEAFLLRRPLLQAITQPDRAPVLLVDEVDRCVAARTLVTTTAGIRRAEDIEVGDELVSFDPESYRLTRSRVKRVVPRETTSVLRVFVGGRVLEVTPEHRFARYTGAGWEVVQARDLREGDRLPLSKRAPFVAPAEPQVPFGDDIVKVTAAARAVLHAAYAGSGRTYADLAVEAGVSPSHLCNVMAPRPSRRSLRAKTFASVANALGVESALDSPGVAPGLRVNQSVAFYELLGYIVADGCFTSDRLCISDKDATNLALYAQKFEEAFGRKPRILRGPHNNWELTHHSLPLGRYLRRLLRRGFLRSRQREVPPFVFELPDDKKAAFVRGYLDGEGWVADHQVSATSASLYLLVGFQHLLSSLGVDSHVSSTGRPTTFGRGPYFTLTIADRAGFARRIGFCSLTKQARLGTPPPPPFTTTELLPEHLVRPVLESIRQREVPNGKPSHQTIHDILAGRVKSNKSSLARVAAAFESADLGDVIDRDVVLGEVRVIQQVDEPQTVYDFVLDGTPYFVANQVVTHNCDEEFEAFMLEVFADWQVTIPEIGTIKATHPPHVILTSNRTRELSDALRRRCLYLWIDYPSFEKELRIVERKVPGIDARLAREVAHFMESLRRVRLSKVPGVAETLDWAQALADLHADHLDEALVAETLGCVLKDADDIKRFRADVAKSGLAPFLPVQS